MHHSASQLPPLITVGPVAHYGVSQSAIIQYTTQYIYNSKNMTTNNYSTQVFTDKYNKLDGVGPVDNRPSTY